MELGFDTVMRFIAAHGEWAVLLIFLVSFAESFAFLSLLVPGTAILAASGALIPSGALSVWALLAGAIPGAILGDGISFWIGRRYGAAITGCWPCNRHPAIISRGEAFLARHGAASVGIGRFFGPIRAIIPLLAGVGGVPAPRFWTANILSAVVWAPAVMLPGAALGWIADHLEPSHAAGVAVVTALLVLGAACVWLRRRWNKGSAARRPSLFPEEGRVP